MEQQGDTGPLGLSLPRSWCRRSGATGPGHGRGSSGGGARSRGRVARCFENPSLFLKPLSAFLLGAPTGTPGCAHPRGLLLATVCTRAAQATISKWVDRQTNCGLAVQWRTLSGEKASCAPPRDGAQRAFPCGGGPCAVLAGGRRGSSSAVTRSRPSCLREGWAVGGVGSTGSLWAMCVCCLESRVPIC